MKFSQFMNVTKDTIKAKSPEIMLCAGIAGFVGTIVISCRQTIKAQAIIAEAKEQKKLVEACKNKEVVTTEEYTEQDAKNDMLKIRVQTGAKLLKNYAPAIIMGGFSIFALFKSHRILSNRNAALAQAYNSLSYAFEEYKNKLNNLRPALDDLGGALHLDEARNEVEKLEEESAQDGFWNDTENSQRVQKRIKTLKHKLERYEKLSGAWEDMLTMCEMAIEEDDDSMLPDLESEFHSFEETLESMRLETLLTGEYDANNAILTFHAGAGGTEAQDWTSMLYRMYNMWAERHGYTVKLMDYLDGDEAGIKSATIMIEGENAYGFLKSENGIHRLVRISPFDASGRRHTSFAAVEVMPEITEDSEIELRDEDIKMDVYRSSGAGGQKVNKTSSAVRLTHIPTGIVVSSQVERSHFQNLENCKNMLRARLAEIKEREHLEKISDIKGVQLKIEWGSQIRSYVFMPYTLAKDHRTGYENGNIQAVMDGDIDGFINAYLSMNADKESK